MPLATYRARTIAPLSNADPLMREISDIELLWISVVPDPLPGCEFRVHPADVIGDGTDEVSACGEGRGSAPEGAGSDLA